MSSDDGRRVAPPSGSRLRPELLEAGREALQGVRITERPAALVVRLEAEAAEELYRASLIHALGADPQAAQDGVAWDDGGERLIIEPMEVQLALLDGFALVQIQVRTDAEGEAQVVLPFALRRPADLGSPTATVPRGPEPIVARWGESLLAVGLRALADLAEVVARAAGEPRGASYVAAGLTAIRNGLRIEAAPE